jgi:hypothetical protein
VHDVLDFAVDGHLTALHLRLSLCGRSVGHTFIAFSAVGPAVAVLHRVNVALAHTCTAHHDACTPTAQSRTHVRTESAPTIGDTLSMSAGRLGCQPSTLWSPAVADTTGSGTSQDTRRQAIEAELKRLEESAKDSAQSQFEQAKQWRGVNLGLGVPTSVFAAIAGAMVLAEQNLALFAGVMSLLAAAGGAILTTVNAAHRMNQASAAANAYLEIQTAARQARLIDLPGQDLDDAKATLDELTARRDEQNRTAEVPNRRAYRKGQKNIAAGGQTYEVDRDKTGT